ncbi:methyl-accepting chemotaxis protein [Chitinimonas lacunae]|uniref:Methyl-accepting chemotaxis protein n=1 Tax=Chitinimonas lacunae TaxID=1963018 RepID=A0ABV8MSU4_9NEIS
MLQRISHRLGAFIVLALIGLWITGLNGLYQLNSLQAALNDITKNVMPRVQSLDEIQRQFNLVRIEVLYHVLEAEAAKRGEREKSLSARWDALHKSLDDYAKLPLDDINRQMLAADKAALASYETGIAKALELSRSDMDSEAREYLSQEMLPKANAVAEALGKHGQFNNQKAIEHREKSEDRYRDSLLVLISLMAATTLLLLWVSYGTYRKVVGTAHEASRQVSRVARELDFSQPIPIKGQDELSELLHAFNGLIHGLRDGLGRIRNDAERLTLASAELAGSAEQITAGSVAQSDASANMAANVEQVTVSIGHVSNRTDEASSLTRASGSLALNGRDSVISTVKRIEQIADVVSGAAQELNQLEESGRQISAVVSVIKEVAEQTNLLALNAAIEAARAGEQGRGFAVVADEVRKLAERTAGSTVEIANMVQAIQQRSAQVSNQITRAVESVRDGVREGVSTRDVIEQIANSAEQGSQLVDEIATALREQSAASNSIAGQVERVAQMAEQNSRAAERGTELSKELQRLATTMNQVVGSYRL